MFNPERLNTNGVYMIEKERGLWHYEGVVCSKYRFWRDAVGTPCKVRIKLTQTQVERKVWESVRSQERTYPVGGFYP